MELEQRPMIINARQHDLGSLIVRRVLPFAKGTGEGDVQVRRHVGPFVFLDHIGPTETEQPMFVSEHPHIGLATATYLFEGEILHKDSLGSEQVIRERELNLMTAGEWITHIEQGLTNEIHGLQFWIALPLEEEECAPKFQHCEGLDLPMWTVARDVVGQVLLGEFKGHQSKAEFPSRALFAVIDSASSHVHRITLELNERETGIYVCEGSATIEPHGHFLPGQLLILDQAESERSIVEVELAPGARLAIFGGDPLDAPRHMKWNYVASDKELIERAEAKWAEHAK